MNADIRIMELEAEVQELKEKLALSQESKRDNNDKLRRVLNDIDSELTRMISRIAYLRDDMRTIRAQRYE